MRKPHSEASAETRLTAGLHLRQDPPRPSILVVDDEAMIRAVCARALDEYEVLQAASGEEALRMLDREQFDLVLSDVMMAGMDGLDLLRTIKERDPHQAVVIMTGLSNNDVILRALRADADDFINKPIELLQLRTTVQRVLEKMALKRELVELRRLDRMKTDFLGLVSHKLKTPITAISLFIQNLAQGIGDPDDPAFRKTLSLVMREADYLSALIQDLLHCSEVLLQDGPPRLQEENPMVMAAAVAAAVREKAAANAIRLTVSLPGDCPAIPLDRERFAFAMRALLDNAIKFTPAGGTVELVGAVTEGTVSLAIRDTGRGISREDLPKVFEKFYQVDPERTGQVRGFGLGLFYARRFVHDQGGTLRLESVPGIGTQATIRIPLPIG